MTFPRNDKKRAHRVRAKPESREEREVQGNGRSGRLSNKAKREQQFEKPAKKQDFENVPEIELPPVLEMVLGLRQGRWDRQCEAEKRWADNYNAESLVIAERWADEYVEKLRDRMATRDAAVRLEEYLEEWHAEREQQKEDMYTMEQLAEDVEDAVAEVGGRGRLPGEDDGEWFHRLQGVEKETWSVFCEYRESITAGLREYVDGLPARESWRPFTCRPHFRQEFTDEKACLRCFAEGMRCSFTVRRGALVVGGEEKRVGQCSRCVRNGAECVLARADASDEEMLDARSWWAGREGVVEEMLARKRGDVRGEFGMEERRNWALPRPATGEWPWDRKR